MAASQRFEHPAQQLVLQEMLLAAQHAQERLTRIEAAIVEFLSDWFLAPMVQALQALRGVHLVTATTIMAEIADLRRVESAWTYRHPPRVSKVKHYVHERVPSVVRDIAMKAQLRVCARYRALAARGKPRP